ncbi:hypothetical protein BKA63DRAFT_556507 [Paraphoma chrysanthemicola]|nr:hypothetical protein BKA63DRAFT_556507 [Paraphoma chrysanthemicola]
MIPTISSNMPAQTNQKANGIATHHEYVRTSAPLTIHRGTPEYLSVIKPEALRDIRDYILDKTGALGVGKIGHELTNPTGTKFVFDLCLGEENDDEGGRITMDMEGDIVAYIEEEASDGNGQVDSGVNTVFINESTTTKTPGPSLDAAPRTEAARKARLMRSHKGVLLASLIVAADSDSPPLIEAMNDEDVDTSTTTPRHIPLAVFPQTSPDDDTSPEAVRTSYLPRSKGSTSLAAFIEAASHSPDPSSPSSSSQSDSDSDTDISSEPNAPSSSLSNTTKPIRLCYDPTFPGHVPCATHRMRRFGRSHIAATQLLRDRFEARCAATGYLGWYRAWVEVKWEMMEQDLRVGSGKGMGKVMVHGGSRLRFEIGVDEVQEGEDVVEEEEEVIWDEADGCDTRSDSLPEYEMLESSSSFEEDVDCPGASEMGDDSDTGDDGDEDGVGLEHGFVLEASSPFEETVGSYEETTAFGARLDGGGEGVNGTEVNHAKGSGHAEGISTMPDSPTPSPRTVHINNTSAHDTMSDKTSTRTSVFSRASGMTKSSRESCSTEDLACSQPVDALHIINCMVEGDERAVVPLATRAPSSASSHENSFEDFDFDFEAAPPEHEIVFDHIDDVVRDDGDSRPKVVAHDERDADGFAMPYEDDHSLYDFYGPAHVPFRRFRWARKMTERAKQVPPKIKKAKRELVKSSTRFTHILAGFVPAALTGRNPYEFA